MTTQTREIREEQFSVASFDTDFTGRLSLQSLFDRFGDIAGHHASYLEVGFETLKHSGLAWMLSRVKVKIDRLPDWGDTVSLRTWPKGVDRLFALRDFRLNEREGRTLALATTCWLLVDIEKGKPRRVESLNVDLRFPGAEHAIVEIPGKIQPPHSLQGVGERRVVLSELDMNGHVNNAHYVRWVLDVFDPARFRSTGLSALQLNYLDQAFLGDCIAISMSADGEIPNAHYVEGTSRNKGTKVFQALVEWK